MDNSLGLKYRIRSSIVKKKQFHAHQINRSDQLNSKNVLLLRTKINPPRCAENLQRGIFAGKRIIHRSPHWGRSVFGRIGRLDLDKQIFGIDLVPNSHVNGTNLKRKRCTVFLQLLITPGKFKRKDNNFQQ